MGIGFIHPQSQIPIFRQIADEFERLILTGELKPGEFLTSVREFALKHEVNPNTVAKAYQQLQAKALVEPVRGTGLRVKTVSEKQGRNRRQEILFEKVDECLHLAQSLGVSLSELLDIVKQRSRK